MNNKEKNITPSALPNHQKTIFGHCFQKKTKNVFYIKFVDNFFLYILYGDSKKENMLLCTF